MRQKSEIDPEPSNGRALVNAALSIFTLRNSAFRRGPGRADQSRRKKLRPGKPATGEPYGTTTVSPSLVSGSERDEASLTQIGIMRFVLSFLDRATTNVAEEP